MKMIVAVLLLFSFFGAKGENLYCNNLLIDKSEIEISKNGKYVVLYEQARGCVAFVEKNGSYKVFHIKGTEGIKDVYLNLKLNISNDSKYALITFNASEDQLIAQVISLNNMKIIFEDSVGYALWSGHKNNLIIVPKNEIDDYSGINGLSVYSVDEKIRKIIFDKYLFTSNIKAEAGVVTGNVVFAKNGVKYIKKIILDIKTDEINFVDGRLDNVSVFKYSLE